MADSVSIKTMIDVLDMSYTYSNVDGGNTLVPQSLVVDLIALLKAQEPVEPVFERRFMTDIKIYDCGKCGTSLGAEGIAKYCMNCGQAVKWDD